MDSVSLTIDNVSVHTHKGAKILWAALDSGIYIPNLCALREKDEPSVSCRLCFVEIEGRPEPVLSCAETVQEGMIVTTKSPKVERLRRSAAELLLSAHNVECKQCFKNGKCELQRIAKHLKITLKPKNLRDLSTSFPLDDTHPKFFYDQSKCVLCGKCVEICHHHGLGILNFAYRGLGTRIFLSSIDLDSENFCMSCERCEKICPVGALIPKIMK
ncbi:MAG: 2Fe-2S iron-sulfur cluster-binding protein [Thermodesulfobacteriota bacterium]|nr:2Fe-2S iron-sulfur cluster-binding protein [Thermodesulfobacteriota bacterium]